MIKTEEFKRFQYEADKGIIYDSITDKDICIVYNWQEKELKFVLEALNNYSKKLEKPKTKFEERGN